jgi:wobble nucleotide-excising tRNase
MQALRKVALNPIIQETAPPATDILLKRPTGNVITKLQAKPELNLWAKKGWELHRHSEGEECSFCGQKLTAERVQQLDAHFSREYQDQLDALLAIKSKYLNAQETVRRAGHLTFNSGNFYQSLSIAATERITRFQSAIAKHLEWLDKVVAQISEKEQNLFVSVKDAAGQCTNNLEHAAEELNEVVEKHNALGNELATKREEVRLTLTKHAVAQAATNTDYYQVKRGIAALQQNIQDSNKSKGALEEERRGLVASLDDATKGAEVINEVLTIYFGKRDLRVEPNDRKRLSVTRGSEIATNLSEGEKTAISFAHFLVSLTEKGGKLEDVVAFIDDPISSLDANHLFGVATLIQDRLHSVRQLFVSTHNHDFFDLLLDWRKNKNNHMRDDSSAYLVRRIDDGSKVECALGPLPDELLKFRSEYLFLFSIIHRCQQAAVQSGDLLTLPNAMRRFLEAFMRFKYLDATDAVRWNKCFGPACERVRTFVNMGSHENVMKSTRIPDRQESIAICNEVVEMLRRVDPDHLAGLVAKLS